MFGSWGYVWFMDVGGGSESGGGGLMGILKPRGHHSLIFGYFKYPWTLR